MTSKEKLFREIKKEEENLVIIEEKNNDLSLFDELKNVVSIDKLDDKKFIYEEKKGSITLQGKTDNTVFTATVKKTKNGDIKTLSTFDKKRPCDYKEDVKELYKEGYKQREIALKLDISQSTVSKLLKS